MSSDSDSEDGTYMQSVAKHEFEEFEKVSDLFYEMIDSLHRLGDMNFLSTVKVDGSKLSNPHKIKNYLYNPYNVIKIMSDLEKVNTSMDHLRTSLTMFLSSIDRFNITDPERKRTRQNKKSTMETIDAFLPLIVMLDGLKKKDDVDSDLENAINELTDSINDLTVDVNTRNTSVTLNDTIEDDDNITADERDEDDEVEGEVVVYRRPDNSLVRSIGRGHTDSTRMRNILTTQGSVFQDSVQNAHYNTITREDAFRPRPRIPRNLPEFSYYSRSPRDRLNHNRR